MHTRDIVLIKVITCIKGQASPALKGLQSETGTFIWNNVHPELKHLFLYSPHFLTLHKWMHASDKLQYIATLDNTKHQ